MTPIKLKAPLKDYLWGGTKLKTDFGKETDLEKVAESWELSCHKDGPSIVASGEDQGLTLPQYLDKHGKKVLGTHGDKFQNFPILIKLIDAKDNLSIQVHPDNEFALRVEGEYRRLRARRLFVLWFSKTDQQRGVQGTDREQYSARDPQ